MEMGKYYHWNNKDIARIVFIKFIPYHRHEWWEYWKDKDYEGYMTRRKSRAEALKGQS